MSAETVTLAAGAAAAAGRTIRGLLIPWAPARALDRSPPISFAPGSVDHAGAWPLRLMHDAGAPKAPIGLAGVTVTATETAEGLEIAAVMPDTSGGNDALELVRAGIAAGLSAEVRIERSEPDGRADRPGRLVTAAALVGAALVHEPAIDGARVTETYQRRPQREGARRRAVIAAALA